MKEKVDEQIGINQANYKPSIDMHLKCQKKESQYSVVKEQRQSQMWAAIKG